MADPSYSLIVEVMIAQNVLLYRAGGQSADFFTEIIVSA